MVMAWSAVLLVAGLRPASAGVARPLPSGYDGVFALQPGQWAVPAELTVTGRRGRIFRATLVLGGAAAYSGFGTLLPDGSFRLEVCAGAVCYRMLGRMSPDGTLLSGQFAALYAGHPGDVFGNFLLRASPANDE